MSSTGNCSEPASLVLFFIFREVSLLPAGEDYPPPAPDCDYFNTSSNVCSILAMFSIGVVDLLAVLTVEIYFSILRKGGKIKPNIVPLGNFPIIVLSEK